MKRVGVRSSILRSVGYDDETATLEIEFTNGSVYRYQEVPRKEYESLLIAMSKGRYFQQKIDGKYRFNQVGNGKAGR